MKSLTELAVERANLTHSVKVGLITWTQFFWAFKKLEEEEARARIRPRKRIPVNIKV